jgi:endoglucanase
LPALEGQVTGRESHWQLQIEPWLRLRELGVGVHVGEWGAYSFTPHAVVLDWMRNLLANWKQAEFGWAMWNLRGPFGPLDSNRKQAKYETYRGHRVDRAMLDLLRA